MAIHTYVINPLVSNPNSTDVLWTCTGTADGIPFSIQFWQSAVANMTLVQIKVFVKTIIDAQVFPMLAVPTGTLANFSGGTFIG